MRAFRRALLDAKNCKLLPIVNCVQVEPLPQRTATSRSLTGRSLAETSWLAERAFGVVTTRLGLAVRVKTTDFEDVVKLVQPENYTKFLIKRTAVQKARPNTEIQKWAPASDQKKTGRNAVFPQTWAAVVASPAPQKAQESRGQKRSTETLGTSQPSKTVNLNTTPTAMDLGDVVQALARPSAVTPMIEGDHGELIARAVAAAMTPLDAQLKMLQTEIIAMNSLEGINGPDGMGDI